MIGVRVNGVNGRVIALTSGFTDFVIGVIASVIARSVELAVIALTSGFTCAREWPCLVIGHLLLRGTMRTGWSLSRRLGCRLHG